MNSVNEVDWRRNLAVCLFGSFATVFAMTLILPFLPVYIEQLGVEGHASIVQWAGISYSATFLTAGLVAMVWGHIGDRFGWKPMLIRASLGMALTVALMGFATNIWQFVGLRLIAGVAGGYSSAAMVLIAVQAPRRQTAWALSLLSLGVMTGNLVGPLAGGLLPNLVGMRATFWGAGALIFTAFIATAGLVKEGPRRPVSDPPLTESGRLSISQKAAVVSMLVTGLLLMIGNRSAEPILAVYVATLVTDPARATVASGFVMSAAALGSIFSASLLGRIADRTGHFVIIVIGLALAGLLLIPQALATTIWQLIALRFLMGLALGGLLPCIAAVIRHTVPDHLVGTVMGYSLASQFAGQVVGPLAGGFIAGKWGMSAVFFATSALLVFGAVFNWRAVRFLQFR